MGATVKINRHGVERVRAMHCWIYRSDLIETNAEPGDIVTVQDQRGSTIGIALYSSRSQIALRIISFEDRKIDREFWISRLNAAEELRKQVVGDSAAYRLIYGESDFLPSLIVDRYNDCYVVQTLSQGMDVLKPLWIDILAERYSPRAIVERNEGKVRDVEGLSRITGLAFGEDPGDLVVEEPPIKFEVNLLTGQKTGAFLDQRENRVTAGLYSAGSVADCFTFQGGFALHMAARGAKVIGVDISESSITQARRNAELNHFSNVEFVEANVFDWLREAEQRGELFDTINLDPPAFAKNKRALEAATRGYKEINLRAMRLLRKGGILITSSCSYHVGEIAFLNILSQAAADARRSIQIIEKRTQARDHPILLSMPETFYLKCFVLRVE
jgi:23S rRNA (cytosine1962-C5)-methyltransferase